MSTTVFHVLAASLQTTHAIGTDWRPVDILVTVLLAIIGAISGWTLKTVLQHQDDVKELQMTTWGKDGKNGHASKLRALRKGFRNIERYLDDLSNRLSRVEERMDISVPTPPRARHALDDEDDTEED